ncbi:MAG: rhamnulokinase, partial [Planctomycetes bacterium]|nr:rhamnulokinase [Planctomycetota bacterium]
MSGVSSYLAIDLGAESGRAILGRLEGGRLKTEEVHRFANEPVMLRRTLCWDFPRIFREVVDGIQKAAAAAGGHLSGIAVDSWGVDFGLLDAAGDLLSLPVHYRDARTRGAMEEVFALVPREEIFQITGLQFLELNTLVQLAALRRSSPHLLAAASRILPTADLVAYFLCGRAASELTLASTTQLLDARARCWSERLIRAIDLRQEIFPGIVHPGTVLAPLDEAIARGAGLDRQPPVIACGCHDTASAVAAVPAAAPGSWAYLSSGTWSLIGVELPEPNLGSAALEHGFTNEAGVFGTIRFLKNIIGLWIVQECRRQWAREGEDLDYAQLAELAAQAPPQRSVIDPDDPDFFTPGDMPARIREKCRERGQPIPATKGEVIRVT